MLSIIIPTLNEEKIIGKTLKALSHLKVAHEIIISDGGSSDNTLEIARPYAHKIVQNHGGQRQTIGQGKNLGAEAANGSYLVFVDADVEIPNVNKFFLHALNLFEADPGLSGLTVFLKVFPEHATLSDKFFFQMINSLHYIVNNWLRLGSASGEFQMIKKSAFKELGGYNEKMIMGEDNDMFTRLATLGRTRVETGLHILHTSRRAHKIGWFRLLSLWVINNFYNRFLKRSFSKEWKVIR